MTSPTDRGKVIVRNEADGTTTVMLCAGFRAGKPIDVFAIHSHVVSVEIQAGINLRPLPGGGTDSYTDDVVQVYRDDDGTVHVHSPAGVGLFPG